MPFCGPWVGIVQIYVKNLYTFITMLSPRVSENDEGYMLEWEGTWSYHSPWVILCKNEIGGAWNATFQDAMWQTAPACKGLCAVPYQERWWSCTYMKCDHCSSGRVMLMGITFVVACAHDSQWGRECMCCFAGHQEQRKDLFCFLGLISGILRWFYWSIPNIVNIYRIKSLGLFPDWKRESSTFIQRPIII